MATKKISELNALTTPESDDLIAIVDASATETKKITYGNISKHIVNVGTEVEEDSRVNFIKSKNLFDKNNVNKINAYLPSSTGAIGSNASAITIYIPCEKNTIYTISKGVSDRFIVGTTINVPAVGVESTFIVRDDSATLKTITTGNDANYLCIYYSASNQNIDNTIIIEKGSSIITSSIAVDNETFTDTIKVGTNVDGKSRVNVLKSKNLLPNLSASGTTNGVSWAIEGNKLTLNGTASADSTIYLYGSWGNETTLSILKGGTYNFNVSGSTAYNKLSLWLITRASGTTSYIAQLQKTNEDGNISFTLDNKKPITGVYISFTNGTTFTNNVYYLQVNEGSSALPFEPYIVPSINVDGETIVNKNVYSSNEVVIGEWFGKPLYRKAIYFGALPNNTTSYKAHGISNIGLCFIKGTTNDYYQIPFRNISNNNSITTWHNTNNVFIQTNFDGSGIDATLVMEYTKTTD